MQDLHSTMEVFEPMTCVKAQIFLLPAQCSKFNFTLLMQQHSSKRKAMRRWFSLWEHILWSEGLCLDPWTTHNSQVWLHTCSPCVGWVEAGVFGDVLLASLIERQWAMSLSRHSVSWESDIKNTLYSLLTSAPVLTRQVPVHESAHIPCIQKNYF